MKSETISVVALIAVLLISSALMVLLVWKIDMPRTKVEAKIFEVNTPTNAVVKVEARTADINNVEIKEALEILRSEQTNWLSVIGFFGVIFGLVVPVGSYLLQRQSLKDEQERIVKECKDETNKVVDDALSKMKPMWSFVSSAFNYGLAYSARRIGRPQTVDYRNIVNFVIAFDMCLDCLVRASLGPRVVEVVDRYRLIIDQSRTMHQAEWICAIRHLRGSGHPSEAFVTGAEYRKVLSDGSETYFWLKDFFSRIYPWKFG